MVENQGLQAPAPATGTPKSNGMALASMIIGIVSIPISCVYLGLLLGPLAIIFGFIGLGRCKKDPAVPGKGMALAGIICGAVGFLTSLAYLIFIIVFVMGAIKSFPPTSYPR